MPQRHSVTILIGPARSGKAARMRRCYLERAAEGDPSRLVMLVPTRERCLATLDALLAESAGGVLWQPQVATFPRYAEDLLGQLGRPARRLTAIQRRTLLAEAIAAVRRDGRLRYFTPILDRPGLVDTLADFIHRLKTREIRPEAFARVVARSTDALRDIADLYARYQEMLAALDLYDDAGLFWQAKDALAAAGDDFRAPEHLLVDGFQDFSPPQRDILKALGDRGSQLTITLPCCRDRPAVFEPTRRTLDELEAAFPGGTVIEEAGPTKGRPVTTLAHLECNLFDPDAPGRAPAPADSIRFIQAAGRTREVETLAREVKRWLQADPARSPGDVAIILRGEPYAALVAGIFPRYGLPVADAPARPLSHCPPAAWLMSAFRLPAGNYRYRDLAAVLRSPYFPRVLFQADEAALEAADRLLHQLGVYEGAENHLRALRRAAADAEARSAGGSQEADPSFDVEPAVIRRAGELVARLVDRLGRLTQRGTRRRHVEAVLALIDDCRLERTALAGEDPALTARDLAALRALRDLLGEAAEAAGWMPDETTPWATFLGDLEQAIQSHELLPPRLFGRGVRLLDVWSSRALSFPLVVLPGLNDGVWPQPHRPQMLDAPANRPALAASGLAPGDREQQVAEERFLFYMAVTRASAQLIVSRPASDDEGRPQLASPFWDELLRLSTAGDRPPEVRCVSARDTDLPLDEAAAIEEVRRRAMADLAAGAPGAADRIGALARIDGAAPAMLAAVAVHRDRQSRHPFGPFDGVLARPEVIEELAGRFPGDHVFSISRLEDYAMCPFRFLAVTVLRLGAWEVPAQYRLETDEVGLLYHEILREFYARRSQRGPGGTRLAGADLEALRSEMAAAARWAFSTREGIGEGGLPALWEIEKQEIADRLLAYVEAEAARCAASPLEVEPRLFEWSFGLPPRRGADRSSDAEPLVVESPAGPVRIRGRIDRVDLLCRGDAPQALAVVDYKSGHRPSGIAARAASGQALQLPLYLLAADRMLGRRLKARPAQGLYWYLRDLKAVAALDGLGSEKRGEALGAALQAAQDRVREIIGEVRRGRFPPAPAEGCPSWCEFQALCRNERWRTEQKQAEADGAPDE